MTGKFLIYRVFINDPPIKLLKPFYVLIFISFITVALLNISACSNKPEVITESKVITIKPPVITPCQRLSIPDCKPTTNGELFECTLGIQKNLNICADQVDALITWQDQQNIQKK